MLSAVESTIAMSGPIPPADVADPATCPPGASVEVRVVPPLALQAARSVDGQVDGELDEPEQEQVHAPAREMEISDDAGDGRGGSAMMGAGAAFPPLGDEG